MSAPSKGHNFQRVKIPPTQSLANGVEQIYAAGEVMNLPKPCRRMQQAATQVNVLSPVMVNVMEADDFHRVGRQYLYNRKWQESTDSVGILGSGMLQDGNGVNLGDLLYASLSKATKYRQTSQSRQECWDGKVEVGFVRSTRSMGKPCTWGRDKRGEAGGNVIGIYASQRAK